MSNKSNNKYNYDYNFVKCGGCPKPPAPRWQEGQAILAYKGRNGEELCCKCAKNICYKCGRQEKLVGWKQGVKTDFGMPFIYEKDENNPSGEWLVYYCSNCRPKETQKIVINNWDIERWEIEEIKPGNQTPSRNQHVPRQQNNSPGGKISHENNRKQHVPQEPDKKPEKNNSPIELSETNRLREENQKLKNHLVMVQAELVKVSEELRKLKGNLNAENLITKIDQIQGKLVNKENISLLEGFKLLNQSNSLLVEAKSNLVTTTPNQENNSFKPLLIGGSALLGISLVIGLILLRRKSKKTFSGR